jgi:hypothetical protein
LDERVPSLFEDSPRILEFGLFVHKIFQQRFPKQKKGTTNQKKDSSATQEEDKEASQDSTQHQK